MEIKDEDVRIVYPEMNAEVPLRGPAKYPGR